MARPRKRSSPVTAFLGRGPKTCPRPWRTAERERGDYAFLILVRGTNRPVAMELLPDPVALHVAGRLTRSEDGWVVGYRVEQAAAER